jgi:CRP/FNR family cyclic AMP-dependent transcriptional regulator
MAVINRISEGPTIIQYPYIMDDFKERLCKSMRDESLNSTVIKIAKHKSVYFLGDQSKKVYFIKSGQIKLLMLSPGGKECLLDIYTAGDTFGESCLAGVSLRQETATAMEDSALNGIPCGSFFLHLEKHSLLTGFVQYLSMRIADQQQMISHLLTIDSEHRLGETMLLLARKLGKQDPGSKRIEQKITHEELSQMVGTTRPRVSGFMRKFRDLGLISLSPEHSLIINEKKLAKYMARLA